MNVMDKRDRLYRGTLVATAVFVLAACALIIGFKRNEEYFDSHGRIAVVAEAALIGQDNTVTSADRKKNFPVNVTDEPGAKLVVPFLAQVHKDKVSISEEFAHNKLVITLEEGTSYIEEGAVLTSDSAWMEAVGVYEYDGDIVIEVYWQEPCGYQPIYENESLTLSFLPIREQYDRAAVVYTPWENRSSLLINEWSQTIQKLQETYRIKIFSTISMKEEYSSADVINFANRVHADMVIGMELVEGETENVVTVCNPAYFIPKFGNTELAAVMEQEYAQKTGLTAAGFKECEEQQKWMQKSAVPTALTQLSVPVSRQTAEQTYTLNQKMMEALGSLIKQISEIYWLPVTE